MSALQQSRSDDDLPGHMAGEPDRLLHREIPLMPLEPPVQKVSAFIAALVSKHPHR